MEIRPGSRPAHNGSEEQLDNRHQASDENLVGRLHAGDEEALTELYARYSVRALHYFQKMLGDLETAQDALQDLFLKLIDARASICVDRKFASWLFAVAHHMCCNEYRSRDVRSRAMTVSCSRPISLAQTAWMIAWMIASMTICLPNTLR